MYIIKQKPVVTCKCVVENKTILERVNNSHNTQLFTDFVDFFSTRESLKTNKLNKKDYSFGILMDTAKDWKVNDILNEAEASGLTIAGDGSNYRGNNLKSIKELAYSNVLIFGKNDRFDVTRESYVKGMFSTTPIYSVEEDYHVALKAIRQFATVKQDLMKKYPRNAVSPTLFELANLSSKKVQKTEEKKNNDVVITDDWIRVGTQYIAKNSADDVIYRTRKTDVIIPGCYTRVIRF
jgi:hypothetical protein